MITENNYQSFCSISSPAKAILCGEHAVVYAKDAIAIGISLHCRANIQKRNKIQSSASLIIKSQIQQGPLSINFRIIELLQKNINKEIYTFQQFERDAQEWEENGNAIKSHFMRSIYFKLSLFFKQQQIEWSKWHEQSQSDYLIDIQSEIPIGKCLGSSAAFNTVFATSLLIVFGILHNQQSSPLSHELKERINSISMKFEAVEHGNPSGIDNYISVNGGVILYNKTKEPRFKKLQNSSINLKKLMKIGVIDTCIEKNTKVAVGKVREKYDSSEVYRMKIEEIGNIASQIVNLLEDSQCNSQSIDKVLKLTSRNHEILRDLGVSHPKIEEIVERWQKLGWSAKITGSGMGGCVLLLSHQSSDSSQQIILASIDEIGLQVKFSDSSQSIQ